MYNILIREKRVQKKAILKWEENDTIFNENDWHKIFEFPLWQLKNLISIGNISKLYTGYHQQIIFYISNNYLHKLKLIDSP